MAALIAVFLAVVSPMQIGGQVSAQNPGAEETRQQSTPESGEEEREDEPECLDDPSLSFCPGPPPYGLSISASGDDITLTYTQSTWSGSPYHLYRFELHRSSTQNGTYSSYRSVNDSLSPAYFNNVAEGYWYKARGKRCRNANRTDCGDWSPYTSSVEVEEPPPPPTDLSISASDDDITVTYTRSIWSESNYHYYIFELRRASSENGYYSVYDTDDLESSSPANFNNVDEGYWYKARGKRCTSSSRTDCGDWSPYTSSVEVEEPPPPPTDLSISASDDDITVTYTRSIWSESNYHYYVFELHSASSEYGSYSLYDTDNYESSSPANFNNVEEGDWYKARGKRCTSSSRTDCGEWSPFTSAVEVEEPPPPPTDLSISASDDDITVTYTRSVWSESNYHYYVFELHSASSENGSYSLYDTDNYESSSPANFNNVEEGDWYKARGKRCTSSSRTDCGEWSPFTSSVEVEEDPPPPTNLSISASGDDITVTYTRSTWSASSSHYYVFELHRSSTLNGTYSLYDTDDNESSSPAYFNNVDVGYWYKARGKRCTSSSRTICGDWSPFADLGDETPIISISGLETSMKPGESDAFTVSASLLSSLFSYNIRIEAASGLGFDSSCSDDDHDYTVPASSTSASTTATVYACSAGSHDIEAEIRRGTTVDDDDSETVDVTAPTISISGLDTSMAPGDSDTFTISATGLSSSLSYNIRIEAGSGLGFDSTCTDDDHDYTVPASSTSVSTTATVYACSAGSHDIEAEIRRGTTVDDDDSETVDVTAPTISISGLDTSMAPGDSDTFTVTASSLSSSISYNIRVEAASGLGFDSTCTDDDHDYTVPASSTSASTTATVYACSAGSHDIEAEIRRGTTVDVDDSETVDVTAPTISISGLDTSMAPGDSDTFTVSATGLSSSLSYNIRVEAASGLGFDSSCSDDDHDYTVPASSTSASTTATVYACSAGSHDIEAEIRRGTTVDDDDSETVDVTAPTISISGLDTSMAPGDSDTFTISATGLSSSLSYNIRIEAASGLGFNSTCTDDDHDYTVPASSTSASTNATVYACSAGSHDIDAEIRRGTTVDDDISQTVDVTAPTISISLLDTSMEIGDSDQFTISATGLSSSVSYNIRVEAGSSSTLKFNSCAGANSADSVEFDAGSGNLSYTVNNVTLYACAAGSDTITATLLSGTNTVDTITSSVTVTAVPRILSVAKPSGTSGVLEIEYSVPKAPGYYQIDILSSETETGHYARVRSEKPSLITSIPAGGRASLTSAMLITGNYYKAKVRVCDTSSYEDDDCGAYSSLSSSIYLPVKLATPQSLDVKPQMLRKARISWDAVTNATGYVIRATGYVTDSDSDTVSTVEFPNITATQYDIDLDRFLGEATADTFRVKAVSSGDTYDDSAFSETIRIVDSPILRADGDNSDLAASATTGTATVEWDRMSGVTQYTLKYRRLGGSIHHGQHGWRPNQFVTLTNTGETVTDSNPSSTDRLTHQRTNLSLGEIYAIQLNYTQNGQKVFSGRDAFVWPSRGFPGNASLVGTYTFFGHWSDKEYTYRICDETFPSNIRSEWVQLIDDAFEEWEVATDGLVTVTKESEECTDLSNISSSTMNAILNQLRTQDSELSEIRMVNDSSWPQDQTNFPEMSVDIFKACLLPTSTIACATSFNDYSSTNRSASNELDGVDVTFKQTKFTSDSSDLLIPGNNALFNQCALGDEEANDKDDQYLAYRTALHEAGHALGLSNWDLGVTLTGIVAHFTSINANSEATYQMSHPTVPDAVMNYDHMITEVPNEAAEPDCSPHPLDIMAVYALYQSVNDDE